MATPSSHHEPSPGARLSARNDSAVRPENLPTSELFREALDEAMDLIRLEVKLAQHEVRDDIAQLARAGILLGLAAALGIATLALIGVVVIAAFGVTTGAAAIVAGVVLVGAVILGLWGYAKLPKKPLERTRKRLNVEARELKEHVK